MVKITCFAAAALAFSSYATAAPAPTSTIQEDLDVTPEQYVRMVGEVGNTESIRASCQGQSCLIADLSGSTGNLPKFKPVGGDEKGYKCIAKYNMEGIKAAQTAPSGPAQPTGLSGALVGAMASLGGLVPGAPAKDKGSFTGRCTKNIVLFARGTTETGQLGITVGPVLSSGLTGRDWSVVGVPYDADMQGDNCLGLPGGMVARDMINQAAAKCPEAKIFMSGYSEGGMVSHNGVAYANEDAKKKVAAVVAFGDPFQGAKIKGYDGPILTYCNDGDAVCTGNFVVGMAHLSYTGSVAQQAMRDMRKIAAGQTVTS